MTRSRPPSRGFGIAAGRDLGLAAEVAAGAEALRYASVWTNDTPGGDGFANAAAMLGSTTKIRAGIGALACDRWPVSSIVRRCESLGAPLERLTIIVGPGQASSPIALVEQTVAALRERFAAALSVGVAALGPGMCRLAGRTGDVVLLNWATPQRIAWSRQRIAEGASGRDQAIGGGEVLPVLAAYVRVAVGAGARAVLSEEASRYARTAHYARHFNAMGEAPGVAAAAPGDAGELLRPYDDILDETIVRAVASSPQSGELLAVAQACAP